MRQTRQRTTGMARAKRLIWLAALLAAAAISLGTAVTASASERSPVERIDTGLVQGNASDGGYSFLGLPYAAPPTGNLRWRPPQPPSRWNGVRDATHFAPSCPQSESPFAPPPPFSEDCLYLNVYTSTLHHDARRPVLVWIHGGGFTEDGARNYDGSKLAADGAVVVTINYRLGALGFLAHPALASRPGGPAGNYGLMDQQAALRWVRANIQQFGGDPHNVTIAGQSAGGVSVLAQLVSPGARGLFERAIVQSGAFALTQQSLPEAEAAGEQFAAKAGCPGQTAKCLRGLPVSDLVTSGSAIPGVVDGAVLPESIGAALAQGRYAHVPILDGINGDEELIFTAGLGLAVSGGRFVPVPEPVTPQSYAADIAAVLGVSITQAEAVTGEYPLSNYPSPTIAFSTLVSDRNFACPARQLNQWTSRYAPTYAYEFDDENAPERFAPLPPAPTHSSEIQYLFDEPNAPLPGPLTEDQQRLAASMRAAWVAFATNGNPSTRAQAWPAFNRTNQVMSLIPPEPHVWSGFSAAHHCVFWGGL